MTSFVRNYFVGVITREEDSRSSKMSESDDNEAAEELANELFENCQFNITEEGIREIIERHKLSTSNNHHHQEVKVSDSHFLQMACTNEKVTEGIMQCLLDYFPDAVNDVDMGMGYSHSTLHVKTAACHLISFNSSSMQIPIRFVSKITTADCPFIAYG